MIYLINWFSVGNVGKAFKTAMNDSRLLLWILSKQKMLRINNTEA
jgi:hypothetical protein